MKKDDYIKQNVLVIVCIDAFLEVLAVALIVVANLNCTGRFNFPKYRDDITYRNIGIFMMYSRDVPAVN